MRGNWSLTKLRNLENFSTGSISIGNVVLTQRGAARLTFLWLAYTLEGTGISNIREEGRDVDR